MQTEPYAGTSENPEVPELGENIQVRTISRKDEETDAAWLAGIIDGEGSLLLAKRCGTAAKTSKTFRVRFVVGSCDVLMIRKIKQIFDYHGIKYHIGFIFKRKALHNNDCRITCETYCGLKRILKLVIPYLTTKKEKALFLLSYIEYRESKGKLKIENRLKTNVEEESDWMRRWKDVRYIYASNPQRLDALLRTN